MPRIADPSYPDCWIDCDDPNGFARFRRPLGPCVRRCGPRANADGLRVLIEEDGAEARFSIEARMGWDGLAQLAQVLTESPALTVEMSTALRRIDDGLQLAGRRAAVHVRLTDTDAAGFLDVVADQVSSQVPDAEPSLS